MSSSNLVKNTTFFTAALTIQKILSFVYFILVARSIGVENTGKYSFALSFTTIFAMFLDFGLTQILIRESARDIKNSQKYLANVLGLKLLGSVIIYALVIVVINLMGYPEITKQLVYVSGFVMLLDSFALSFYGILRGHQNLRFESYGVILNQLIVLGAGLVIIKLQLGLVILMGAYLLGSLFNFFYAALFLKIKLKILTIFRFDKKIIKELFRLALPFAIAGFFIRIYSSMDIVLLSKLANDKAVGLYSVAYKITFALQFVAVAFSASIYPAFCRYFVASKELLSKTFAKSMYFLMLISLPISFGVIVLADKFLPPIFGQEYQGAILPLQILISSLVLVFLCFPIGAMLNACDKQTRNTVHLGIIAVLNIILNLILIPLYGYNGAAVAALISYVVLFALGIVVIEKIVKYDKKYLLISFAKITFSCLVMSLVVVWLKGYWSFVITAPLGALVYLVTLVLVGGFSKKDIMQTKSLLFKKENAVSSDSNL
ncbi:MAG: flippase [Patescibacteria group bacterium]